MNGIKNAILSVCIMHIVQYIFVTLSSDKFRGLVKSATSVIILAATLCMIVNIDFSDVVESMPKLEHLEGYISNDELIIEDMNNKLSNYICEEMMEIGFSVKKVEVTTYIDEDRCINISVIHVWTTDITQENAIFNYLRETVGEVEVNLLEG